MLTVKKMSTGYGRNDGKIVFSVKCNRCGNEWDEPYSASRYTSCFKCGGSQIAVRALTDIFLNSIEGKTK